MRNNPETFPGVPLPPDAQRSYGPPYAYKRQMSFFERFRSWDLHRQLSSWFLPPVVSENEESHVCVIPSTRMSTEESSWQSDILPEFRAAFNKVSDPVRARFVAQAFFDQGVSPQEIVEQSERVGYPLVWLIDFDTEPGETRQTV